MRLNFLQYNIKQAKVQQPIVKKFYLLFDFLAASNKSCHARELLDRLSVIRQQCDKDSAREGGIELRKKLYR